MNTYGINRMIIRMLYNGKVKSESERVNKSTEKQLVAIFKLFSKYVKER